MTPLYPLAVFEHCPRCGSSSGRAETVKQYVCPDCAFEYFQNAAAAVIVVARRPDGKVLFARREREPAKGRWDLPGGFVDPLETAEEALAREVREEVGIELGPLTYLGSFTNRYAYKGVTYYTLDLAFSCTLDAGAAATALDEVTDVAFLDPAAVSPDDLSFESVRAVIRRLVEEGDP